MSDDSADLMGPKNPVAPGVGCFGKGTLVWGNLGFVAVDELRPGDRILVVDAQTGKEVFRPLTEMFEVADTRIVSLALEGGEMVSAHPDQPYRLESNEIRAAREVEQDAILVTAGGGRARVVHNVQVKLKSPSPNYGIRVAGGTAVFVGQQGLMASIAGPAVVTREHQPRADSSTHI